METTKAVSMPKVILLIANSGTPGWLSHKNLARSNR